MNRLKILLTPARDRVYYTVVAQDTTLFARGDFTAKTTRLALISHFYPEFWPDYSGRVYHLFSRGSVSGKDNRESSLATADSLGVIQDISKRFCNLVRSITWPSNARLEAKIVCLPHGAVSLEINDKQQQNFVVEPVDEVEEI